MALAIEQVTEEGFKAIEQVTEEGFKSRTVWYHSLQQWGWTSGTCATAGYFFIIVSFTSFTITGLASQPLYSTNVCWNSFLSLIISKIFLTSHSYSESFLVTDLTVNWQFTMATVIRKKCFKWFCLVKNSLFNNEFFIVWAYSLP